MDKKLKILFVEPAAQISISDVGRGYRSALERQGHDIRDYNMVARMQYHASALPPEVKDDQSVLVRQASENILNEAVYSEVDLVVVVSGLNVHPIALWSLAKVGIPVAVILTESPYDDDSQAMWADMSSKGVKSPLLFTNDRSSAERMGWGYLPPAFDPAVHHPVDSVKDEECDVVMVGTGWQERQAFLEAVNWNGIKLRIYGVWPDLHADSPLHQYYSPLVVDNTRIAPVYCSAKICLNFHRKSATAYTPNPRAYELAACGAFQLSDPRPGLTELFGDQLFTFDTPKKLEDAIHFYLQESAARMSMAGRCKELVQGETFDKRAEQFMAVVNSRLFSPPASSTEST